MPLWFVTRLGSNRVSSFTAGDQLPYRVDVTPGGDTLVTWLGATPNAARVGGDAATIGAAFALPSAEAVLFEDNMVGAVFNVRISPPDQAPLYALRYQRFGFDGTPLGQALDIAQAASPLDKAVLTALPGGRASIAYVTGGQVRVATVDGTGLASDIAAGAASGTSLSVETLADGNVVVAWNGGGNTVHAQIYRPDGVAVGAQFTRTNVAQGAVWTEALPDGGYVAAVGGTQPRLYFFNAAGQLLLDRGYAHVPGTYSDVDIVVIASDVIMVVYQLTVGASTQGYAYLFFTDGRVIGSPLLFGDPGMAVDALGDGVFTVATTIADPGGGNTDVLVETYRFPREDFRIGGSGTDTLSALDGNLTLIGLGGDDIYYVDSRLDVVQEYLNEGYDSLRASDSYGFYNANHIEDVRTTDPTSTKPIWFTGNSRAQYMEGNAGENSLIGNGGGDTLVGLGGDDHFYVAGIGDIVVEAAGGGNDRVYTTGSYVLPAGQEIEMLLPLSFTDTVALDMTGNAFAGQIIYGNAGPNQLSGGGGGDLLTGFAGDDRYIVTHGGDLVYENAGEGYDRVLAAVDYRLTGGAHVEIVTTTDNFGTAPLYLAGNALGQAIFGNAGANVLVGNGGGDSLVGLGGDDHLYVEGVGDLVYEAVGGGNDRVYAAGSYVLPAGQEIEMLLPLDVAGIAALDLTGNALAGQLIYGNAGANQLSGGGGGDLLTGFGGNDRYLVTHAADRVFEDAGGGEDRVLASVDYRLNAGSAVEMLTTIDNLATAALHLFGNGADQSVYGNAGGNVLGGGGGRDTLVGMGGEDKFLFDVAPNSAFVGTFGAVAAGSNVSLIHDMGVDDKIQLAGSVFGLAPGVLAPGAFNTGRVATEADDRILYDPATQALLFDADGVGGAEALLIGFINNPFTLDASYFQVV